MKLLLFDQNPVIVEAFKEAFKGHKDVLYYCGDFRELEKLPEYENNYFDLVSAGNSYGVMNGGLDYHIARHFLGVETQVRKVIREEHHNELNVGDAIHVQILNNPKYAYLIYTPTMRSPKKIINTDAVYLAMRAALLTCYFSPTRAEDKILAVPGLGGGCGKVPPVSIAAQMELAYRNYLDCEPQLTVFDMQTADYKIYEAIVKR